MNVPLVVKVWIVCHPLVVIVPPVDVGDTPSEPFVAYERITTPEPPFNQAIPLHPHPHPQFPVLLPAVPHPFVLLFHHTHPAA